MAETPLAWIRLLRLPNHATAVADVAAGYLVVSATAGAGWPGPPLWWAVLASLGFYAAGMVQNDVCDLEVDRLERPDRPLPSGRIPPGAAAAVGNLLLTAGGAAACATAFAARNPWPALVGASLTAAVWAYNRHAKRTGLGPAVMGACRGLNWLLGMTAAGGPSAPFHWLLPVGMGVFVMGITVYARDEAGESRVRQLAGGMLVMLVGLATAAVAPWVAARDGEAGGWLEAGRLAQWTLLWGMLAASVMLRGLLGIADPSPGRVQQAVGNAIMSIITLDAVLVLAFRGEAGAVAVLCLLVPFLLGRRLASPT